MPSVQRNIDTAHSVPNLNRRAGGTQMEPLYPDIEVQLVGLDGNAFSIMGRVTKALADAGVEKAERTKFQEECMAGDYDHLLQTCIKWVSVS